MIDRTKLASNLAKVLRNNSTRACLANFALERECKSKSGKISLLKPLIWATELSVMIFSAILNYSSLMDL